MSSGASSTAAGGPVLSEVEGPVLSEVEGPAMSEAPRRYLRFRRPDRDEHIVLLTSFTILAITGMVQKFPEAGLSQAIISALGGIETTRTIHRVAAVVLMLEGIFHLGAVSYKVFVRRTRLD